MRNGSWYGVTMELSRIHTWRERKLCYIVGTFKPYLVPANTQACNNTSFQISPIATGHTINRPNWCFTVYHKPARYSYLSETIVSVCLQAEFWDGHKNLKIWKSENLKTWLTRRLITIDKAVFTVTNVYSFCAFSFILVRSRWHTAVTRAFYCTHLEAETNCLGNLGGYIPAALLVTRLLIILNWRMTSRAFVEVVLIAPALPSKQQRFTFFASSLIQPITLLLRWLLWVLGLLVYRQFTKKKNLPNQKYILTTRCSGI